MLRAKNSKIMSWQSILLSFNYTRQVLNKMHFECIVKFGEIEYDKSFLHDIKLNSKELFNVRTSQLQHSMLVQHHKPYTLVQVQEMFKKVYEQVKTYFYLIC